jgi:hypothetical protein
MARRGRKRQLHVESLYWQLILSGVGTVVACKEAGIGRKTGYGGEPGTAGCRRAGWRRCLVGPVPVTAGAPADRDVAPGRVGVRAIAGRIGRAPSTVSRELRRTATRRIAARNAPRSSHHTRVVGTGPY